MLNVLQVASKVLGKNPPYFAGSVLVPQCLISTRAACVQGKLWGDRVTGRSGLGSGGGISGSI